MSIVVTTPTGQIGRRVVRNLIQAGERPILIVRDPSKLDAEVRERSDVRQGDQKDADFLREALTGTDTLFWLSPPDYGGPDFIQHTRTLGESVHSAVRATGVSRVVHLSGMAAERRSGMGMIDGLGIVEEALDATDADVVHLRPGFFYENFFFQLDALRHEGAVFYAMPGDLRLPHVATSDIAQVATQRLLSRTWRGKIAQGVHGPRDISFREAAEEVSLALGREIRHVEITDEQLAEAFARTGAGPKTVEGYVGMFAGLRANPTPAEPRTIETTTPTTLAAWAIENLRPALTPQLV